MCLKTMKELLVGILQCLQWYSCCEMHSQCLRAAICVASGLAQTGASLLLRDLLSLQAHGLPSSPVLKSFQQTVERRSIDSLLFFLEDGSR